MRRFRLSFATQASNWRATGIPLLLLFLAAAPICDSRVFAADGPVPKLPATGLVLGGAGGRGVRSPVIADPIEALRLEGKLAQIKEGDEVTLPNGQKRKWEKITADKDGVFRGRAIQGGYLRLEVEAEADRVMILHAAGFLNMTVNGEPRVGDPYGTGWVQTPVLMKAGKNEILIQSRGNSTKPELTPPQSDVYLTNIDMTLPDLIRGESQNSWAGIKILNATQQTQAGWRVRAGVAGGQSMETPIADLPPLSQSKIPVKIAMPALTGEKAQLKVELIAPGGGGAGANPLEVELPIRSPLDKYRRTFISDIDGSVQYYSVVPAKPDGGQKPGLTLTLHGAGVEASGQAACFAPKTWTHVVAATNRRPFGFDWEDWGRLDALEVLADAEAHLKTDPRRRWLTGHSMGGHGTWHLGVTFPDKFAAIGPSAGWISMFTYAGMRRPQNPDPIAAMLQRATLPSDTFALADNFKREGVYILHGDQDDNVPVQQARTMRETLAKFHPDFVYHEQPGAGHWWGNPCVDWKPMFDFFEARTLPERKDVRHVEFATASPGVSPECFWARIEAQIKPYELSTIQIDHDPAKSSFKGTTKNVARLALDVSHLPADKEIDISLDGSDLKAMRSNGRTTIWLERADDKWKSAGKPSAALKGPRRNGSFKDAFRHHVLLVYGTKGTPEENAWALAKARYDAETFWYRGNGSFEVIPDTKFNAEADADRNVVLYGHADMNSAWKSLLGESPVQVRRGSIKVGEKEEKGDDLASLFVRPRAGSAVATIGVVAGTGLKGLKATNRQPYFVSGVGYPDLLILGGDALSKGLAGIKAAGYFGNDWSVEKGDIAWR